MEWPPWREDLYFMTFSHQSHAWHRYLINIWGVNGITLGPISIHTLPSFLFWEALSIYAFSLWGTSREAAMGLSAAVRTKRGSLWHPLPPKLGLGFGTTHLSKFQLSLFVNMTNYLMSLSLGCVKIGDVFAFHSCCENQIRYPIARHIVGMQ